MSDTITIGLNDDIEATVDGNTVTLRWKGLAGYEDVSEEMITMTVSKERFAAWINLIGNAADEVS